MKTTLILLAIVALAAQYAYSAKVFSCDQGCKDDGECPNNSHCVAINQNSECGMCLCKAGYKSQGQDCVPNKSENKKGSSKEITTAAPSGGGGGALTSVASTQGSQASTSASGAPSTTLPPTTPTTSPGTTTQGPPPAPVPINCADYNCPPAFGNGGGDGDNPFTVRASIINTTDKCKSKLSNPGRPCKMTGGGVCYGIYCLPGESGGGEYCICDFDRIDRQCAIEKPGKCDSATSTLPQTGYKAQNKRYRNKNNPENGSIYGRHFAASFDDCVKLCTWSGGGTCRSVNYGTVSGQKVCELLSIAVTKGNPLESWLVDASGWQYAQVLA